MVQTSSTPTLSRRSSGSPWRTLGVRAALAGALLLTAFALLWFDRDGLRDQIDGELTFPEVIYFTMITITTVGYGDIVPVSERARLIDAFLITPIRLFLWLIFLGTAFDMLFKRSWERLRMRRIQKKLCDHIVVAGFGRHGSAATAELVAGGVDPSRLVVIDCKEDACAAARELGAAVLQGDASSDDLLKAVHIERAAAMIISAGRDDTSILIVLTARALAPKVPIAVTIGALDNEDIARHAGADQVINPIMVAGRLLAQAARPGTAAAA
ncbi:potassium channel family protein [Sphingomonas sp.]|uniref:potassium channel family protein n=1 Tax=Sphingomonas sp. TaxID=28214 RepID=UPI00286D6CED|nr:potassium channel family protein [Sphingomonas sp.]